MESQVSNQVNLLQYYIVRDWAREIVSDIDRGAAGFRTPKNSRLAASAMQNIREQQLRVIEILDELVAVNSMHASDAML